MAERGPFPLQADAYSAEDFRQMMAAMFGMPFGLFAGGISAATAGGAHGVVGGGDLLVSQNGTPNMSVNVAAGRIVIGGTEESDQGPYIDTNNATYNVTIAAADATNARKDLIVFDVRDQAYSGSDNDGRIRAITGTPAGSPADPTVPDNCVVLARVNVPALDTAITDAQIDDLRTFAYAIGGTARCTSTTRPSGASLYEGLKAYELDTNKELVYDGSGWVETNSVGAWETYTPTITSDSGSPTLGNAVVQARYRRVGRTVWAQVGVQVGTTSNFATGLIYLSLPFTMRTPSTRQAIGTAECYDLSGSAHHMASCIPVSPWNKVAFSVHASGGVSGSALIPFGWAAGDVLSFTVTYEAAS